MPRKKLEPAAAEHSPPVRNRVKSLRVQQGLSQQELARAGGVTRQTISNIEGGLFVPSVAVAMRLARALGCRVEDLFWLEETYGEVEALWPRYLPDDADRSSPAAGRSSPGAPGRYLPDHPSRRWQDRPIPVTLARVGPQWVAHPLVGTQAFQVELVPADGLGQPGSGFGRVRVQLLEDPESLSQTVVVAGCAPVLSMWAKAAERRWPGLRVLSRYANSEEALGRLARGEIHVAGVHLYDPATGEFNSPFVRRLLTGADAVLITLGTWEEGLVVRPGNPLALRRAADLARSGVKVVNREPGAGSRALLEAALLEEGVPPERVAGFDRVVLSHHEVARAVASGQADAGVSSRGVASLFGLDFVPWRQVRYDLVVLKAYLDDPPVRQLLSTLMDRRVRWQLKTLGGYDTATTGDVVAEIAGHAAG